MTPEGRRTTQLDTILLNGNNIAIVRARAFACARCAPQTLTHFSHIFCCARATARAWRLARRPMTPARGAHTARRRRNNEPLTKK
jgi:hypothetical protein